MNRFTPCRLLIAALLLVSLGGVGCGNKGPLKPPPSTSHVSNP
ncbi:hypothetical protein QSV34_06200 [Porticoccus sp. W117]|nr:hypothetical protein [Porticoccus sp. W117]MDM3870944.1 hypothetical protein [Porticoccus sp. W117]